MNLLHKHDEKLQCPYKGCEKRFDKPTVITDQTTIPRQSHYACPYCMSKINILTEKEKIIGVKAIDYPTVFTSPAKCAHFSSSFQQLQANAPLPDECLICPKAMQCNVRKK